MTRYVCVCFCGQVSTKYLEPFCAIPRILCAADNPCALPGPDYFPELALMHAAASVMLETVLASGEHRVLAQKLHQEKRDEYDKHKQQQAALLAHRRVETDTEERHRLRKLRLRGPAPPLRFRGHWFGRVPNRAPFFCFGFLEKF